MPTPKQIAKIAASGAIVYGVDYVVNKNQRDMKIIGRDLLAFAASEYFLKGIVDKSLAFINMPNIQAQLADFIGSYGASILMDMAMSDSPNYRRKAILYIIAIFGENLVAQSIPAIASS